MSSTLPDVGCRDPLRSRSHSSRRNGRLGTMSDGSAWHLSAAYLRVSLLDEAGGSLVPLAQRRQDEEDSCLILAGKLVKIPATPNALKRRAVATSSTVQT